MAEYSALREPAKQRSVASAMFEQELEEQLARRSVSHRRSQRLSNSHPQERAQRRARSRNPWLRMAYPPVA